MWCLVKHRDNFTLCYLYLPSDRSRSISSVNLLCCVTCIGDTALLNSILFCVLVCEVDELLQDRVQWEGLVLAAMNFRVLLLEVSLDIWEISCEKGICMELAQDRVT